MSRPFTSHHRLDVAERAAEPISILIRSAICSPIAMLLRLLHVVDDRLHREVIAGRSPEIGRR